MKKVRKNEREREREKASRRESPAGVQLSSEFLQDVADSGQGPMRDGGGSRGTNQSQPGQLYIPLSSFSSEGAAVSQLPQKPGALATEPLQTGLPGGGLPAHRSYLLPGIIPAPFHPPQTGTSA